MQQQLQKQARNLFGAFQFPNFPSPFPANQDDAKPAAGGSSEGSEHKG